MKIRKNSALNKDLARYAELKRAQAQIEDELDEIKARVVTYMNDHNTDTVENTEYTVTYKMVIQNRIDTTELKKHHPKIAAQFTKAIETHRFCFK